MMTTEYERGRIAGIEAAAKVFDDEAEAASKNGMDIAATIFERHAELVRQILPPASTGAGGDQRSYQDLVREKLRVHPYDAPSCPAADPGMAEASISYGGPDRRSGKYWISLDFGNWDAWMNARAWLARALASSAQRGEPNG